MKVLFINLADTGGLGGKSTNALKHKYGETNVHLVNAIPEDGILPTEAGLIEQFEQLPDVLISYDRIILAAHGTVDDTHYCYYERVYGEEHERLFDARQLANNLLKLCRQADLPEDKELNITLAICYAARTSDYKRNHELEANQLDFTDTFAYRFLRHFKALSGGDFSIELDAYIGAVEFKDDAGELVVATEEQLRLDEELRHVSNEYSLQQQLLNTLIEKFGDEEFSLYEENDEYLVDTSELGIAYRYLFELENKKSKLQTKLSNKPIGYGKIGYRSSFRNQEIGIFFRVNECESREEFSEVKPVTGERTPLLGAVDLEERDKTCCKCSLS